MFNLYEEQHFFKGKFSFDPAKGATWYDSFQQMK
jgi:hypothetical protein